MGGRGGCWEEAASLLGVSLSAKRLKQLRRRSEGGGCRRDGACAPRAARSSSAPRAFPAAGAGSEELRADAESQRSFSSVRRAEQSSHRPSCYCPTSVLSDFQPQSLPGALCCVVSVQLSRVGAFRTGSKNTLCSVVHRPGQVTHRFDSDWFLQRAHLEKNPVH